MNALWSIPALFFVKSIAFCTSGNRQLQPTGTTRRRQWCNQFFYYARIVSLCLGFVPLSGCASRAVFHRGAEKKASIHSPLKVLRAPGFWIPAVGAMVFGLTNLDNALSRWASTENPIYGSRERAALTSDILVRTSLAGYIAALSAGALFSPPSLLIERALLAAAAGSAAIRLTDMTTIELKTRTARLRPDSTDSRSFPSGHTSTAMVFSTLAASTIVTLPFDTPVQSSLQTVAWLTAAAAGWGRVEGAKHYPSDVLAGAALGYLWGTFFSDLCSNHAFRPVIHTGFSTATGALHLGVRVRF